MTTRKAMIAGAILTAIVLIGFATTWAVGQPAADPQDEAGRPFMRLIRGQIARTIVLRQDLNLTDEQRAELRGILSAHKAEFKPLAEEAVAHKRALRAAVMAEHPDEAAIRAEATALGSVMGDIAVAVAGIAGEARQVLTPEQMSLIDESLAQREAAVDEWLGQLGG